jgi:hypothetical protein
VLVTVFTGAPSSFTCEADILVLEPAATELSPFLIGIPHGNRWIGFGLNVAKTTASLWVYGTQADGGLHEGSVQVQPPKTGEWQHVELTTDFVNASMKINGTPSGTLPVPSVPRTGYEVYAGLGGTLFASSVIVHVDNVACNATQ